MARKVKRIRPVGPPSKKTAEVLQKMIEVARSGLPLRFVAAAGGISQQTLCDWRDSDPAFGLAIEQARAESVRERWEEIRKQGVGTKDRPGNWAALGWQLERSFPSEFGRPEVQFHQQNVTTNNVLSITVEQAEKYEERSRKICDEIDELLAQRQKRFEAHQAVETPAVGSRVIDAQAEVILSPIVLPPGASWWAMLCRGAGSRTIDRKAFMYVLQTVMTTLYGAQRAAELEIDLGREELRLRDLRETLQSLGGPPAWQVLLELGGAS